MKVEYKGYQLEINDGKVVYIELNGQEVGIDDCPASTTQTTSSVKLEDAVEWINEDIKCREEDKEIIKK